MSYFLNNINDTTTNVITTIVGTTNVGTINIRMTNVGRDKTLEANLLVLLCITYVHVFFIHFRFLYRFLKLPCSFSFKQLVQYRTLLRCHISNNFLLLVLIKWKVVI